MTARCTRRSLTFLLVAGLALTLAACGGTPSERPAPPATTTATAPPAAEATAPPTATPPPTTTAPIEATATPSPTPNATSTATPSPTATPTATATPAAPTPTPTPTADATAAGTPSPTTFRYNILDTTGAATAAGSYAFLTTAGDATSAFDTLGAVPAGSVELRIHPVDASGTSRAAFYDTVKVGESFDYRTNGLECGLRFKVTSVATTTTPTFGLEWVFLYGGYYEGLDGMPGAARDVEFVWGVGPGIPDPDGVNALLRNEPAGAGTYRLYEGLPYVIDVPSGKRVTLSGYLLVSYRARDPGISPGNPPNTAIRLIDTDTGSVLFIDPDTGGEISRATTSPDGEALFDQIMASIRIVE